MDQGFREKLLSVSISADVTMERFMGNEMLYKKFLTKFLEDSNFSGLLTAYGQRDVQEALRCAHTLKGVSANLGLDSIVELLSPMVAVLRSNEFPEDMEESLKEIETRYQGICSLIRTL